MCSCSFSECQTVALVVMTKLFNHVSQYFEVPCKSVMFLLLILMLKVSKDHNSFGFLTFFFNLENHFVFLMC